MGDLDWRDDPSIADCKFDSDATTGSGESFNLKRAVEIYMAICSIHSSSFE